MTRKSPAMSTERFRQALVELLTNFHEKLQEGDLRTKVQALVPAYDLLDSLGSSLIPRDLASSARERIRHYMCSYSLQVIPGSELRVVAGISEWARRVRELRVEFGWKLISGITAKEMNLAGELDLPGVKSMLRDDYILVSKTQDRDSAYRWHVANEIRRRKGVSVQHRILEFLRKNVGAHISGEELRYVAGEATEWARRVRELRTEEGWPVVTKYTGDPSLDVGIYVLEADRQAPAQDRKIPAPVYHEVLRRDGGKCQECGWSPTEFNRADHRYLELHHVEHHAQGGGNEAVNLITLCNVCHDDLHKREAAERTRRKVK